MSIEKESARDYSLPPLLDAATSLSLAFLKIEALGLQEVDVAGGALIGARRVPSGGAVRINICCPLPGVRSQDFASLAGGGDTSHFCRFRQGREVLLKRGRSNDNVPSLWSIPLVLTFAAGEEDFIVRVMVVPEIKALRGQRQVILGQPEAWQEVGGDPLGGERGW